MNGGVAVAPHSKSDGDQAIVVLQEGSEDFKTERVMKSRRRENSRKRNDADMENVSRDETNVGQHARVVSVAHVRRNDHHEMHSP